MEIFFADPHLGFDLVDRNIIRIIRLDIKAPKKVVSNNIGNTFEPPCPLGIGLKKTGKPTFPVLIEA